MNIRKRVGSFWAGALVLTRSTAGGRARRERRRFWAAIAGGARVKMLRSVSVPAGVGTRWFRKAGACRHRCLGYRRSRSVVGISRLRSGRKIALLRVQGYSRRSLAGSGGWHRQSPESCGERRYPKRRPRVSCDDSAMARRARCSPPGQAKLARNAALRTYVEERLAGVVAPSGALFPARSCPGKPSARTTEGPAMGKRLEPGADRPSPAGGLRGRRDHAHQP